jgi:DNA-binding transcriptional MerR regulator
MVRDGEGQQRRLTKAIDQGAVEIYRLRTQERLSFIRIARQTGRSPERIRQILKIYCVLEGLPFPGGFRGR